MGGARKRARVMVFEIAKRSVGGTGKAIRTWAIAGYYGDVRDVSSIILIAEITGASMAPTTGALGPPYQPPRPNFLLFDPLCSGPGPSSLRSSNFFDRQTRQYNPDR